MRNFESEPSRTLSNLCPFLTGIFEECGHPLLLQAAFNSKRLKWPTGQRSGASPDPASPQLGPEVPPEAPGFPGAERRTTQPLQPPPPAGYHLPSKDPQLWEENPSSHHRRYFFVANFVDNNFLNWIMKL